MTSTEKEELASYQLKDVDQLCFTHCEGNKLVEASPIDWEVFKKTFLNMFFHWKNKEANT